MKLGIGHESQEKYLLEHLPKMFVAIKMWRREEQKEENGGTSKSLNLCIRHV